MVPLTPMIDMDKVVVENDSAKQKKHEDPHLRSTMVIKGYNIHANDISVQNDRIKKDYLQRTIS